MRKTAKYLAAAAIAALMAPIVLTTQSCGGKQSAENPRLPDTLRVATLYSPRSYFIYRDEPMGYDYSLISQFAEDKGMQLSLEVAP